MAILDTVGAGLEQVKDMLVDYSSRDNTLLSMIKMSTVAKASRWGYRIPFLRWRGGVYGKISLDEGTLHSGTGPSVSYMTAGFIPSAFAIKLTDEQIKLSEDSAVSRYNVIADIMANVMEVMTAHDNIHFLGDGTGFLTNVSSAKPTNSSLRFQTSTDDIGVNWTMKGMAVDIWDSAGTTKRADGPYTIINIDYDLGDVTFNTAPTGLTSGDRLAAVGTDVFGPSAPTTKSSTWPGGGLTNGPGLTGDSWRHGLEYANAATLNEYYLTKLKSSFTELVPQKVNLDGHALSWEAVRLGKNKLIQARDNSILDGLMGVTHLCQTDKLAESQVNIAQWNITEGGKTLIDIPPQINPMQLFNFDGIPTFGTKLAKRTRVDFLNVKNWGRVEAGPPDYYRAPNSSGPTFFPVMGTTGTYKTAWQFWILNTFDWVCHDPGAAFYLYGAEVKQGYHPGSSYAP